MRAPLSPARGLPRAAALALCASLAVHAALLLGERPQEEPRPAKAVTLATLAPPTLPLPLPETTTPPPPAPRARAVRGVPRGHREQELGGHKRTANLSRRHDLPTPESPMRSNLNR